MKLQPILVLGLAGVFALGLGHAFKAHRPSAAESVASISDADLLFYEGVRRGYVLDDLIVRREMVRRVRDALLQEHPQVEPSDADLSAFLLKNADKYQAAARYSFDQVYLSHGEHTAHIDADALAIKAQLQANPEKFNAMGDPFPRGHHLERLTAMQIEADFGRALAQSIATLTPGQWQGPLASPLGIHFARVSAVEPGRVLTLPEARARLRVDYILEQQRRVIRDALLQLRKNLSGAAPLPKPAAFEDEDAQ